MKDPRNWLLLTKVYFIMNFMCAACGQAIAQPEHWINVTTNYVHNVPTELFYSENLDITVYCAPFFEWGNLGAGFLAAYNGESWVTIADTLSFGISNGIDYDEGFLLCGGQYIHVGPGIMKGVAYYDGSNWSYPWEFDALVRKLIWANDTLFAIGSFSEIDGVSAYRVAKLVGNQWQGVLAEGTFPNSVSNIFDLAYYDGHYYIGGNFLDLNGLRDFARLENMTLHPVEGTLTGANLSIHNLTVYQDELYLSGWIPYAQGNVGNNIVKFDGNNFSQVGGLFTDQPGVFNLQARVNRTYVKNGYLYAVGIFRYNDGVEMYGVARWDGTQWCGLYGNELYQPDGPFLNQIFASGFYQDQLMVFIDYTDEDNNYQPLWLYDGGDLVGECSLPLSAVDGNRDKSFSVFPNPANTTVKIYSSHQILKVNVRNALGQILLEIQPFAEQAELDVSGLTHGIYLVEVQTPEGSAVEKLVVK